MLALPAATAIFQHAERAITPLILLTRRIDATILLIRFFAILAVMAEYAASRVRREPAIATLLFFAGTDVSV